MSENIEEIKFLSSDGEHNVYAKFMWPEGEIKGIVQICHGMNGYIGKYDKMASFLLSQGYAVCGHTSIGHWDSVSSKEELGFFGEFNGYKYLIKDAEKMTKLIKRKFPGKSVILFGHSMGSFIARCCVSEIGEEFVGAIFSGTAGPQPLADSGIQFANVIIQKKGYRYRSRKLYKVLFDFANREIKNPTSDMAWVSTKYDGKKDSKSDFLFTVTGLRDVLNLIKRCNDVKKIDSVPKDLPLYFFAGTGDPVGEYGEGVKRAIKLYKKAGIKDVEVDLYEGDRHECFNEFNEDEVFSNMMNWIRKYCDGRK